MGGGIGALFDLVVFPVVGGIAGAVLGTLVLGSASGFVGFFGEGLGGFLGFFAGSLAVLLVTTRDTEDADDASEQRVAELEREVEELRRRLNDADE